MDEDRAHTFGGQFAGYALGHLLRIAVHRAVGDHHARFAFVAAQTVVDVHHLRDLALPYGAVGRADGRGVQAPYLRERLLYRPSVFADDAGVVAAHFVPVARRVYLRVGNAAVDGAERAEGVAREERAGLGTPCHHRFGPVYHRRHVERERFRAERYAVALLDFERPGVDAVESLEHLQRLGVAHDLDVGVEHAQCAHGRRVVGFHVVDDQVVDLAVADGLADVLCQTAAEALFDGIYQCDLLVGNQIGIV